MMKFVYEYRTRDNVPHRGTIAASAKEAAYDTLKARGIKPGKLWEAPGFFNKLFGKGKRWIAIVFLLFALVSSVVVVLSLKKQIDSTAKELEDISLYEERGQIYGAPAVIADMEANDYYLVFGADDVARFLAQYAIPAQETKGHAVIMPKSVSRQDLNVTIAVKEDDLDEVKHLKRMVNRMKREMGRYLDAGGSVNGYLKRLDMRQEAEQRILTRVKGELQRETNAEVWREKNAQLRAMGLPMVDPPSSVEQQ